MSNITLEEVKRQYIGKTFEYSMQKKGVSKELVGEIVDIAKGGLLMDTKTKEVRKNTFKVKIKPKTGRAFWTPTMELVMEVPKDTIPLPITRVIRCSNMGCTFRKQDPKNKRLGHCACPTDIRLEKVWNGNEDDYQLLCMQATNKVRRHAIFE